MANTIRLKRKTDADGAPLVGDLVAGELALNNFSGRLFMEKTDGGDAIVEMITDQGGQTIGGDLTITGTADASVEYLFTEAAAHTFTPVATRGILWVRNDTPNVLVFTDDAGTDWDLSVPGATGDVSKVGTTVDNRLAVWTGDGTIESQNNLHWNTNQGFFDMDSLIPRAKNQFGALHLQDTSGAATPQLIFATGTGIFAGNELGKITYDLGELVVRNLGGPLRMEPGFSSGSKHVELADGGFVFNERADHAVTPEAAKGELWIRSDTPNVLVFTDDAGTDWDLNTAGGSGNVSNTGTPLNDQIAVWTDATTVEGTTGLTYNGTALNITGNITLTGTVDGIDIATDVAANTAKVTNATHTGQVTGATALALDVTAITAQPASGALTGTDTLIVNDGGVLSEATMTQIGTFVDIAASSKYLLDTTDTLTGTLTVTADVAAGALIIDDRYIIDTVSFQLAAVTQDNWVNLGELQNGSYTIRIANNGFALYNSASYVVNGDYTGTADGDGTHGAFHAATLNRSSGFVELEDIFFEFVSVDSANVWLQLQGTVSGVQNYKVSVEGIAYNADGFVPDGTITTTDPTLTASVPRITTIDEGTVSIVGNTDITGNITLTGTVDGIDIATDVAANTAKVTNATHTGQVTGATALALDVTAITAQPASGAIAAADTILINDGGVLSEATFTQMDTYFNSSLSFGAGDVTKVGTPADNQVGVWTGDGTIEGDTNLTFNGAATTTDQMTITANASLTTGSVLQVSSNLATKTTSSVVEILQDHASANVAALSVRSDTTGASAAMTLTAANNGLNIDTSGTSSTALDIRGTSCTGLGDYVIISMNNAAFTGNVVNIIQDSGSATADALVVQQDGTGDAVSATATTVSGTAGRFYSNAASRAQPVCEVINDNATGSGVALYVQNDQSGAAIDVVGNIAVTGTVDGVDIAARDHDAVTKAGTGTYISLAGQVITVDPITQSDISDFGGPYLLDTTDTFTGTLTVTGQLNVDSMVLNGTSLTGSTLLQTDEVRTQNGNYLVINAGESHSFATAQTAESVYINAEAGLQINSSPDNWASLWAGRDTAVICGAGGASTFPGNVGVTGNITVTGTVDGRDIAADGTAQDSHIADASIHTEDNLLVHLAGAETITGAKTFTSELTVQRNPGTTTVVYNNGHMELLTTNGDYVSMGFHRSGFTACQLRHELNGLILSGTSQSNAANFTLTGDIDPTVTNTQDIGASGLVWANVWATTFEGTATTAQYADLAEKYLTDADYEIGTVLMFGGDKEVTEATPNTTAIAGIVSEHPAFLMNKKLDNSAIVALRGRVPCKVYGPVSKGDLMVAGTGGVAVVDNDANPNAVLGRAIATNEDGYGYIEIVV